ncbi:MAG TPA: KH domain-containing protein [Herpetosiphonaceae bacterium]|nr:KH domain-containing protein [Herpetosiphonaceae bacterium]
MTTRRSDSGASSGHADNANTPPMKELLEYIIKEMVDRPEVVRVRERTGQYSVTLELSVDERDAGKVIGRSGRVAKALRDVLGIAAARSRKRVHLDINS